MQIYNITNKAVEYVSNEVHLNTPIDVLESSGWSFSDALHSDSGVTLNSVGSYLSTPKNPQFITDATVTLQNVGNKKALVNIVNENNIVLQSIVLASNMPESKTYNVNVESKALIVQLLTDTKALVSKITTESLENEPAIVIPENSTMEILCGKSKGAISFSLYSNIAYACKQTGLKTGSIVSILMSVNGGKTFEPITNEALKTLSKSNVDMILRIETYSMPIEIYAINVVYRDIASDVYENYYDTQSSALDLDTFKSLVRSNAVELSELVEDNKGWPIRYYQAETLKNIDIFNAYEIKSITDYKEIRVLFPDTKTLTQLSFDQFGLRYDDITNMHIIKTTFEKHFGNNTRPENVDIIYIPFLEQYFEINNVDDIKTNLNSVTYYDCTLKLLTNRSSVHKADGVLDIDDMINPLDFKELNEAAPNTTKETTSIDHIGAVETFDTEKYGTFALSKGKYIEVVGGKSIYGMFFMESPDVTDVPAMADVTRGWYRLEVIDNIVTLYTMKGKEVHMFGINDGTLILPFAKYIEVSKEFTDYQRNQFYSSPVLPHDIKPLKLEWNVDKLF